MREVVITDTKYRMTLTAIWGLFSDNIDITAVEYENTKACERLGFYSKYIRHKRLVPSPEENEELFIEGLISVGREIYERSKQKPVLIVGGSKTMAALVINQDKIKDYFEFNLVNGEKYRNANNTYELSKFAEKAGVPFPSTTFLNENESILELSLRIEYPVVIKYREGEKLPLKAQERYKIVDNQEGFIDIYTVMNSIQPRPLVQSYIEGDGFGVSAVFDNNNEPVEIFCHRRIREYPVSGGPSTLCESIWDDRMVKYAISLLKELQWTGFAMVEFKGRLDGEISLMEINPRFWGSMPLSLLSGCNMPLAYYNSILSIECINKGKTTFENRYKLRIRMQYILQDLLAVKGYFNTDKSILIKFIKDIINPRVKDGLFRLSDPLPGLMYLKSIIFSKRGK